MIPRAAHILIVIAVPLLLAGCPSLDGLCALIEGDGAADRTVSGQFAAQPAAPLADAIPARVYERRDEDYNRQHPDLGNASVSFNVLTLVFRLGTTVAQADALLADIGAEIAGGVPGLSDQAPGILQLRVPTSTHDEMETLLDSLNANPLVELAVQAIQEEPLVKPRHNGSIPVNYLWKRIPDGTNDDQELIGLPQMWNLNAALAKQGALVETGVLDSGFINQDHKDLIRFGNLTPGIVRPHGTAVAGIIAAEFSNGEGIDGVNPYALVHGFADTDSLGLSYLLASVPQTQVVNISLGWDWGVDTTTSPAIQAKADLYGQVAALELELADLAGVTPLVVAAAGNESADFTDAAGGFRLQPARYGSRYANASIVHGVENIIVVEAVQHDAAAAGRARRMPLSNVNGDISAPGATVWSLAQGNTYAPVDGTSFAAPLVTGLAGYMLALEPTLTATQLKQLIKSNGVAVDGGASPRISAFDTVMDIDRVTGSDRVLRRLLDIDDGTLDGNQRVEWGTSTDYLEEDADNDNGIGDGRIDMSDFRRFRDWLVYVENASGLALDGSADHPKKDVDGNTVVEDPNTENVYPRADFNGSGDLSSTGARPMKGAAPRISGSTGPLTDLAVFKLLFNDPHYSAAELDGLLESGDIAVWPKTCLASGDVSDVVSRVLDATGSEVDTHTHTTADPHRIYTLAPGNYTVRIQARDLAGQVLFTNERNIAVLPGSDDYINPGNCEKQKLQVRMTAFTQVIVRAQRLRPGSSPASGLYDLDEQKIDTDTMPRDQTAFTGSATEELERTDQLLDASAFGQSTQNSAIEFDADGLPTGAGGTLHVDGNAQAYRQRWWTSAQCFSEAKYFIIVPEGQTYLFRSEITFEGYNLHASYRLFGSTRAGVAIDVTRERADLNLPHELELPTGQYRVIYHNEVQPAAIHGGLTNVTQEATMEYGFTLDPVPTSPGNS